MADQSTRRRVKLYALNAERQWDDRGTGHVTSTYVEKLQGVSLLVKAESDGNILLESKIQTETIYQKQQETLIVWSEGDNFDLALSFQERAGCDEIWEKICQVQGRDPSVEITQEVVEESEDERFDDMSDTVPSIELPAAEMGKLEEISELINSCLLSAIKREKLTLAMEADNYIPKLMRMFKMCEDLENTSGLHHLHDIIVNLFQLNKNALIEAMFKIDVIFDVVGCLEYDPANPKPTRHREYLKQMANFKQVLPIRNSELLAKIHQTYRVQYIQDIVLPTPSMFEDNVLSTLSSFIFFNKLDIVRQLQDDEKFLTEFFSLLSDEKTPITKRRDLVLFLKEFCTFSHTLQPQSKETFFKTLLSMGVLQALETTLTVDASPPPAGAGSGELSPPVDAAQLAQHARVIGAACVDVLMYIVETVPSMVREHMLQQAETCDDDQLLMNLIIEQMVCDRDPEVGLAVPLSGIIRILIDPDNMMAALNRSEKTEFFSFFYKHCMHSLVAPLLSNTINDAPLHDDPATVQLLNLVLELLSFCVEHHTFHAKNFIITRNMVARILVLMKSQHKYLALDALRFLRKMVALKDENYNRHIVKQNLFAPVVEAFFRNQGRYNLLDSAVIELFEFIKTEDIKTLLAYIVETFGDKLLDVTYVQTFRSLKQRYEQQQDRLQNRTTALESVPSILRGTTRYRRDPRQLDEDEEMWFNDDEEYEEAAEPAPGALAAAAAAAAVTDFEHIGKMMGSRGKLFGASPAAAAAVAAELATDKDSTLEVRTSSVTVTPTGPASGLASVAAAAPAAKLASLTAAPTDAQTPTPSAPPAATAAVKKVGLVDYDADSDEEEEDASEDERLAPLAVQLPAAAMQLSTSPIQLASSPNQVASPTQVVSSPNQATTSPNQLVAASNSLAASPNCLSNSPSQSLNSPTHLLNSPGQVVSSPTHLTGSPTHQLTSSIASNSPNQLASPSSVLNHLSSSSPLAGSPGVLQGSPIFSAMTSAANSPGQLVGQPNLCGSPAQQTVTSSQQVTSLTSQRDSESSALPVAEMTDSVAEVQTDQSAQLSPACVSSSQRDDTSSIGGATVHTLLEPADRNSCDEKSTAETLNRVSLVDTAADARSESTLPTLASNCEEAVDALAEKAVVVSDGPISNDESAKNGRTEDAESVEAAEAVSTTDQCAAGQPAAPDHAQNGAGSAHAEACVDGPEQECATESNPATACAAGSEQKCASATGPDPSAVCAAASEQQSATGPDPAAASGQSATGLGPAAACADAPEQQCATVSEQCATGPDPAGAAAERESGPDPAESGGGKVRRAEDDAQLIPNAKRPRIGET